MKRGIKTPVLLSRAMPVIGKILDPKRRHMWLETLGSEEVPLQSPIPRHVLFEGPAAADLGGGPVLCYMMDLNALTREQFGRVVEHAMSTMPGRSKEAVELLLWTLGMPIVADGVVVTSTEMFFL